MNFKQKQELTDKLARVAKVRGLICPNCNGVLEWLRSTITMRLAYHHCNHCHHGYVIKVETKA